MSRELTEKWASVGVKESSTCVEGPTSLGQCGVRVVYTVRGRVGTSDEGRSRTGHSRSLLVPSHFTFPVCRRDYEICV